MFTQENIKSEGMESNHCSVFLCQLHENLCMILTHEGPKYFEDKHTNAKIGSLFFRSLK